MEFCKVYRCRWSFGGMRANHMVLILKDFQVVGDMFQAQVLSDGRIQPLWARTMRMFDAYFERVV